MVNPKEVKRKTAAKTAVAFARSSSIPFFLPKKASPAPEIAPDNPALLPDWNKTATISPIELRLKRTTKAIFKINSPSYETL
jgi:hypothetical protein